MGAQRPCALCSLRSLQGALCLPKVLLQFVSLKAALDALELAHLDWKLGNLHMDEQGVIRCLDFGLCQRYGTDSMPFTGTYYTMAPELLRSAGHQKRGGLKNSAAQDWYVHVGWGRRV